MSGLLATRETDYEIHRIRVTQVVNNVSFALVAEPQAQYRE
jgi:hypothetical protein